MTTRSAGDVPLTVVIAGLTRWHKPLVRAAIESCGLRSAQAEVARLDDYRRAARLLEGDRSVPLCYVIGSFLRYLDGAGSAPILFMAPNIVGPDRGPGFVEAVRRVLRDAGGDRVDVGFWPGAVTGPAASVLSPASAAAIAQALILGDLIREIGCRVRPYETVPGATESALAECRDHLARTLRRQPAPDPSPGIGDGVLALFSKLGDRATVAAFADVCRSEALTASLDECAELLQSRVTVDYARPKPAVLLAGDFWTRTTDGGGNYEMVRLLEAEGAEVVVSPVMEWALDVSSRGDWLARRMYRRLFERYRRRFRGLLDPGAARSAHLTFDLFLDRTRLVSEAAATVRLSIEPCEKVEAECLDRIRAALRTAAERARSEVDEVLEAAGVDIDAVYSFLRDWHDYRLPLQAFDCHRRATAASFIEKVAIALVREKGLRKEIHWHP